MKFLFDLPNLAPEINSAIDSVTNSTKETIANVSVNEIISAFVQSIPQEVFDKWSLFLTIGTYVLLAIFVYVVIKIIRQIIGMKDSRNISIIAEQAKEINSKLESPKKR